MAETGLPPSGSAPPPAPPPAAGTEDTLLLVLCYLGLLSIVPYLVSRGREGLRFHARQGLALGLLGVLCAGLSAVPFLGFVGVLGIALVIALSIVGIVKALGGQRWRMPVAADVADRLDL